MTAGVVVATVEVVMVKAGDTVAPAATVTETGGVAAALLLDKVTTAPPLGAGPLRVTVFKAVDVPLTADVGDKLTCAGMGGCTVKVPVAAVPP
jgi:hypothetical protein